MTLHMTDGDNLGGGLGVLSTERGVIVGGGELELSLESSLKTSHSES